MMECSFEKENLKTKRKKYFLGVLLLILFFNLLRSQDIHFSQVNETPLMLSPANTGFFNGYLRAITNYKSQWNTYNTGAISVDGGLFRSKKHRSFLGLGLTVFYDEAGVAKLNTTTIQLNGSGLVKIAKRSALSAGVAFGSTSSGGSFDKLTYASQFNGNKFEGSNDITYRSFTNFDLASGFAYQFSKITSDQDHDDVLSFKLAFGAFHLNKPLQEFGIGSAYSLPVRFAFSLTSNIDLVDTKFTINPTVIYQTQGNLKELFLGTYVKYRMSTGTKMTGEMTQNAIGLGLFYRKDDAIVAKLIFDYGDYSIGMAYDFNISAISNNFGIAIPELSLRYNMLASSLFNSKRELR